jgi:ABC-type branched-subunit amino acid transport system ATPase component
VAGVNPALRKEIAKTLKELQKQDKTILLIEHDLNFTLGLSDTAIVLEEGKVIAQGKPSQIRKNKKVLEAYLGE